MVDFAALADHKERLKRIEKKDKYLDLAAELKKTMEHESDGDINCNCCTWKSKKRLILENVEIRRVETIIGTGPNTEKSPG